jgi:hypothetical protein
MLIKLQMKQMIELEIKRNLANETKQYIKIKLIKGSTARGTACEVPTELPSCGTKRHNAFVTYSTN